jgi:hypothetical protein
MIKKKCPICNAQCATEGSCYMARGYRRVLYERVPDETFVGAGNGGLKKAVAYVRHRCLARTSSDVGVCK